jgi:hypothetical protein
MGKQQGQQPQPQPQQQQAQEGSTQAKAQLQEALRQADACMQRAQGSFVAEKWIQAEKEVQEVSS